MSKLSHKQLHALRKKERRKKIRQMSAKLRDENDSHDDSDIDEELLEAREALLRDREEKERQRLHQEWLLRESVAMKAFLELNREKPYLQLDDEQKTKDCKEVHKIIKDLSELFPDDETGNKEVISLMIETIVQYGNHLDNADLFEANRPLHNPPAPENYGTEMDQQNCPFFLKTGACRFGDRCLRGHPKPTISTTILIPGMFSHFSIDKALRDEFDSDMILEYEESECYQHFKEFYEDTLPEFKTIGRIVQFKVCCNFEPHLRGNVYVQFETEGEALVAYNFFNGRWYAGKQLSCEFSPVDNWKSAICGLFYKNKCPKGRSCNFLHVFKNPNNEFWMADTNRSFTELDAHRSSRYSRSHSRSYHSRSPTSFREKSSYGNKRSRSKSSEKSSERKVKRKHKSSKRDSRKDSPSPKKSSLDKHLNKKKRNVLNDENRSNDDEKTDYRHLPRQHKSRKTHKNLDNLKKNKED